MLSGPNAAWARSAASAIAAAVLRALGSGRTWASRDSSIAWSWRRTRTAWPAAVTERGLVERGERAADWEGWAGGREGAHAFRSGGGQDAAPRGLKQRPLAEQLAQVLGERGRADWPEPGAGPAGEDDGHEPGG